jgi:DNA replication protein DnaC
MKELKEYMDKVAPIPNEIKTTKQKDFDHIELDEDEIEEALSRAREEKHYRLKKAKYWEGLTVEPAIKLYTADEVKAKLENSITPSGKKFSIDKDNERIVTLLCQYFTNDPEFEKSQDLNGINFSLRKGLAMMGNVGVGKTYMMGFFYLNQNQSYVMANCRKIEGQWIDQMSSKDKPLRNVIDRYAEDIKASVNSNPFGHQALGVCFDDLGTETSPSKSYGEEKNVLAEILMNRYESGLPFNYTHITTNLSAHDVGIKYGNRVRDRFREMFNLITFDNGAKSRR